MGEYDEDYGGPFQVKGNPFAIKLWEDDTSTSMGVTSILIDKEILDKCTIFEVFCSVENSSDSHYVSVRMYKKSDNIAETEAVYIRSAGFYKRKLRIDANPIDPQTYSFPKFFIDSCYRYTYNNTAPAVTANEYLIPRILVGYCYEPRSKT